MIAPLLVAALVLGVDPLSADAFHLGKYFILAVGLSLGLLVSPVPRTKFDSPAALFLAVMAGLSFTSPSPYVSIFGQWGFYFQGLVPSLLVYFALLLGASHHPSVLLKALVWSCVVSSIVAVIQSFGYLTPYPIADGNRVYSTIGNPVFLACHLSLAVVACFALELLWPLPILLAGLIACASRASLLMIGAGALVLGARHLKRHPGAFLALFMAILAGFYGVKLRRETKQSDLGRFHMARLGIDKASHHIIHGIGPERFNTILENDRDDWFDRDMGPNWSNSYAHNSFLDALVGGGVILFAAYLVVLCSVAFVLNEHGAYAALGLGAALLTFGLFQPTPLSAKAIFALIAGASVPADTRFSTDASISLKLILLGCLAAVSTFLVGGRIHYVAARLAIDRTAFLASRELVPMIGR